LFCMRWSNGKADLRINSVDLKSFEEAYGETSAFALTPPPTIGPLSYHHPDAGSACANKMRERARWFSDRTESIDLARHRARTAEEQFRDLELAAGNIRNHISSIRSGSTDVGQLA